MSNRFCILISVLVALLIGEVGVRFVDLKRPLHPYEGVRLFKQGDTRFECFEGTLSRAYFEKYNGCVSYSHSNPLFRRPQKIRLDPAEGTIRILGLGDSFTYGFGVHYEDTFLVRLERELSQKTPGNKFEVLNAAVPGSSTESQVDLYQEKLSHFGAKVILLGVNLNDIIDFPTSYLIDYPEIYSGWFRRHFRILDLVLYRIEKNLEASKKIETLLKSYTPLSQQRFLKEIISLQEMAKAQSAKLVVLLFPVFYDFHHYAFTPIHKDITNSLANQSIPVVDFLPAFLGTEASNYWITPYDQHPNELAHEIFSQKVLDPAQGTF